MCDDMQGPSRSFGAMPPFQEPSFNPTPSQVYVIYGNIYRLQKLGPHTSGVIQYPAPPTVFFTIPKYSHIPCSRYCLYRTALLKGPLLKWTYPTDRSVRGGGRIPTQAQSVHFLGSLCLCVHLGLAKLFKPKEDDKHGLP